MIFQREQTRYRTTRKNVRYHIYKKKKKSHTQTHNTFSTLEKRQRAVIKRKALSSSASQKSRKSNSRWLERKKGKRDLVLDANITIRCHGVAMVDRRKSGIIIAIALTRLERFHPPDFCSGNCSASLHRPPKLEKLPTSSAITSGRPPLAY